MKNIEIKEDNWLSLTIEKLKELEQELIKARDIIIDVIGEGINAETNIQLENGRHFLTKTILEIDEIIKLTK